MCQRADNEAVSKAAHFGATSGVRGENESVRAAGFLCVNVQLRTKAPVSAWHLLMTALP